MKLDRILVGVDFSPASLEAIRHASTLAGQGTVQLLHVVDTELLPHHAFVGRDLVEQLYDSLLGDATKVLDGLARDVRANGVRVEAVVSRGRAADELAGLSSDVDLVVVG